MIPSPLRNYGVVLTEYEFTRYIFNSLIVSAGGAMLAVAVTVCFAYGLWRLARAGYVFYAKLLLSASVVSFVFPAEGKLVANFVIVKSLGLLDSLVAVFLPFTANLFTLLVLVDAVSRLPVEYDDMATLEGFTDWQKLRYVVMPLLAPFLVAAFIMNFVTLWNDFLWPLLVLQTDSKYTVQVAINYIASSLVFDRGYFATAVACAVLPPLLLFWLFRNAFMPRQ